MVTAWVEAGEKMFVGLSGDGGAPCCASATGARQQAAAKVSLEIYTGLSIRRDRRRDDLVGVSFRSFGGHRRARHEAGFASGFRFGFEIVQAPARFEAVMRGCSLDQNL